MVTDIDFNALITSINKCCVEEQYCRTCTKSNCLIKYCKENLLTCLKTGEQFIEEEIDNIPLSDTKHYNEKSVVKTVGLILNECKNCSAYHDEECIINMLRSACEVILLGSPREYPGSVRLYLDEIQNINAELSDKINESFIKNRKEDV